MTCRDTQESQGDKNKDSFHYLSYIVNPVTVLYLYRSTHYPMHINLCSLLLVRLSQEDIVPMSTFKALSSQWKHRVCLSVLVKVYLLQTYSGKTMFYSSLSGDDSYPLVSEWPLSITKREVSVLTLTVGQSGFVAFSVLLSIRIH